MKLQELKDKVTGHWVKMSAKEQRDYLGHAVFGKKDFGFRAGKWRIRKNACMGHDFNEVDLSDSELLELIQDKDTVEVYFF